MQESPEENRLDGVQAAEEWKAKGNEKYKAKDYRGAIDEYTRAIEAHPDPAYYTNRAAAHMMILQFDKTVEDCDAAIALDANYAKAYARKAKAFQSMGNFEQAVSTVQDWLRIDPNDAHSIKEVDGLRAMIERAKAIDTLVDQGRHRQAVSQIDDLLKEAPASRELRIRKLEALVGCRRYDEAFQFSNTLLRPSETNTTVLFWRAKALYYLGNMDSAIKHLQQALRSDPDNTRIRDEYRRIREIEQTKEQGNTAFKEGRYQDAIQAWTRCLELDPTNGGYNAKLYSNRANAHSKLRNHDAAIKDCGRAIELDPGFVKAYLRRAESLYALGGVENLEACIRDYEHVQDMVDESGQRNIQQKIRQAKIALKRARRKDYYAILGVTQDATDAEIRKAYKTAALKYHPDRHSSKSEEEQQQAANKFKEISEAYEVLSDDEKRRQYDSGVDLDDMGGGHGGFGGGMGGIDQEMLFRMFMQQGMGGGGFGGMGGGFDGGFGGMGGMGGMGGRGGGPRFHFG